MQILLPDYVCLRKDRNRHGGGVCIYLKHSISYSRKTHLEIADLEMISVEINQNNNTPFLILKNWNCF